MQKITVIIPVRKGGDPSLSLETLDKQTFKDFKVVVINDEEGKGASWARNEGFKQCDTEFVLFCDDDINWKPNALEAMYDCLQYFPKASYTYGRFKVGDAIWGHQLFDPGVLWTTNYITTMSLIRSKDFPGFDESIKRFQDWDLWLTMLKQGKRGVYCNELLFTTELRPGISHGTMGVFEAAKIINDKHGLGLPQFKLGWL